MSEKKLISPQKNYPLSKIEYVDPEQLKKTVEYVKKEKNNELQMEVIEYQGYYFAYEDECALLAANITNQPYIDVEVLNRNEMGSLKNDADLEYQMSCIGINTLHDYEEIGQFEYAEYPKWYRKEK